MRKRNSLSALLGWIVAFGAMECLAAPRHTASSLSIDDEVRDYWSADVNGDGLADLAISTWSEERGRELHIHWQSADGRFSNTPSRRIEIKSDIVAIGVADLRPEPGSELLMLTRSAIYSFNANSESYGGNLKKLADWDFIATVPEPKQVAYLGEFKDITGDQRIDFLLPGSNSIGWFSLAANSSEKDEGSPSTDGKLALLGTFPEPQFNAANAVDQFGNIGFRVRNGLRFIVDRPSDFEGLMEEGLQTNAKIADENAAQGEDRFVLDVERWLAKVQSTKLNEDDVPDWLYLDDGPSQEKNRQQLNALLPTSSNALPKNPSWQGELDLRGAMLVSDINGDKLDDIIARHEQGSADSSVLIYLNRGASKGALFDFEKPDQVLRFSAYEIRIEVRDLNGDGKPELLAGGYSLSAVDAIRDGNMLRTLLIYEGGKGSNGAPFDRRPSVKLEEKFSASNFKGLVERVKFDADVDGDGRNDALSLDHQGALVAKAIADNLQISEEPFWTFVPEHLIQNIRAVSLNQDNHSDFILRHQHHLTVLSSQAGEVTQ